MSLINNYYLSSKDAPVIWNFTKKQLLVMMLFGFIPALWAMASIMVFSNSILGFVLIIITLLCAWTWGFISSHEIDGRSMIAYYLDTKRAKRIVRKKSQIKLKSIDVDGVIESIWEVKAEDK